MQALKLSPDGMSLASCGDDGAIVVWDMHNGEQIQMLRRDRPYERLDITGIKGLSDAQKASLRALGAVERPADTAMPIRAPAHADTSQRNRSGTHPASTLPLQPTSFVGRDEELSAIVRILANPSCRLLTLIGPGGMGKTRLALETATAQDAGGYARGFDEEFYRKQRELLSTALATQDVVITTAQVPGRKPPVLVTADAVGRMKSGSVIVDMAASALGGNCELSKTGETVETPNGVTIIAPDNLPATMPAGASAFYARNISTLLLGMIKDGALHLDFEDEVTKSTVISHGGSVVSEAVTKLLDPGGQT